MALHLKSTGIDFTDFTDATESSELLDDYEEGTWAGVISDGTNSMTMSGTYDGGFYTKVGNLVYLSGFFVTTSVGSASGSVRVIGMPFTVYNHQDAYTSFVSGYGNGLNITAGESIGFYVEYGQTYFNITHWDAAAGVSGLQADEWSDNGQMMFGLVYTAA